MICPSRQEADKAVNACHNNKTLPGVSGIRMFSCEFYYNLSFSLLFVIFFFQLFLFFLSIMLINAN